MMEAKKGIALWKKEVEVLADVVKMYCKINQLWSSCDLSTGDKP